MKIWSGYDVSTKMKRVKRKLFFWTAFLLSHAGHYLGLLANACHRTSHQATDRLAKYNDAIEMDYPFLRYEK